MIHTLVPFKINPRSLHSGLTITLLSSYIEYYDTNYHEINNYIYGRNIVKGWH